MKILDATVATFDEVFEKFISEVSEHKVNLILFLADYDPSTNISWCPGKEFCLNLLKFWKFLSVCLTKKFNLKSCF